MDQQEMNKFADNIPLVWHMVFCLVFLGIILSLFKLFGDVTIIDVNRLIYWCVGFNVVMSYLRQIKVYYLRIALSYCIISLSFNLLHMLG